MDKNQPTIDSLLNSAQSQGSDQITQMMDKIQPMLQLLIIISTLLTIALLILYLFNSIHKWRVSRAILRMDKNLQLLVERGDALPNIKEKSSVDPLVSKQ